MNWSRSFTGRVRALVVFSIGCFVRVGQRRRFGRLGALCWVAILDREATDCLWGFLGQSQEGGLAERGAIEGGVGGGV